MTSLNPLFTVESQLGETHAPHCGMGAAGGARARARSADAVGIPEPERRLSAYPHQLSGGQRQRVVIAAALVLRAEAARGRRADDGARRVVQAQILKLHPRPRRSAQRIGVLLVTHNMGVVAEIADRVTIMHRGTRGRERAGRGGAGRPSPCLRPRADRRRAAGSTSAPVACRFQATSPRPRARRAPDVARSHGGGGCAGGSTPILSVEGPAGRLRKPRLAARPQRRRPSAPWTTSASTSAGRGLRSRRRSPAAARRRSPTSSPGLITPTKGEVLFRGQKVSLDGASARAAARSR